MHKRTLLSDISIAATGSYVPVNIVTNQELSERLDTSDEWIVERTGIHERRYADPSESTSHFAVKAATEALQAAKLDAEAIDHVIVATSTPDWPQPATAAAVHGMLGMRQSAGAMDIDAVCSGFVYAVHAGAAQLHVQEAWNHVLVIGADCYSRILDPEDRTTSVFFGDGAGAVILSRNSTPTEASGIRSAVFGTDFAMHDAIIVPAGGTREPATEQAFRERRTYFQMNGPAVFEFATNMLPRAINQACEFAHVQPTDIALVIPHQSNRRIIQMSLRAVGLSEAQTHYTLDKYGNTAAASIPVTLHDAAQAGRLTPGDLVCLVGYGGGLSWGALLLTW